nr:DNA adenine methylase [Alicyclobacillus sendaiensis]
MAKSPLIWFGGKSKLAPLIVARMPPHKVYVEPFGGAAHVIAAKPTADIEVYNDIDGDLVNFLLVARDEPERLVQTAESLPYSRLLYETWKREPLPDEPFERAVRWFYLNRSGIAKGNADRTTGWRHSRSPGTNPAQGYHSAVQLIRDFADRMRNVQIECRDFREVIRTYDSADTLFYVDPPYIGREQYYAGEFTEADHRDLAELLNSIQGKAIVSYYDHPMLNELYQSWRREVVTGYAQAVNGGGPRVTKEVLLYNFNPISSVQMSLWEVDV